MSNDITFSVTVGGNEIPTNEFNIVGGSYGSVGHATITTSRVALQDANIDLFEITSTSPGFTEVIITVQTTQSGPDQSDILTTTAGGPGGSDTTQVRIFGGEYLNTVWDMDNDIVHIKARDWAGQLLDQKRILTKIGKAVENLFRPLAPGRVSAAGISGENQKIGDIVTSIANEFGFNPILNLSESKGNPPVGTLYGSSDQTFITVPQSLWNILNQIARDTGYDVYVTPTKDLVFGEPGAGLDIIQLSYANSDIPDGYVPCKGLKLEHHPRRNSTFRVVVISYDAARAQTVVGRAAYVGPNYAGQHGLTAGISSGSAAAATDKNFAAIKATVGQVALYSFHLDGLSQEQADLRASSIAYDIAKREVILNVAIDGLAKILPTQQVRITGPLMPGQFANPLYYVSQYSQNFVLPSQQSNRADAGWMTQLTALNVPPEEKASTNSSGSVAAGSGGGGKPSVGKSKTVAAGNKREG